MRINIENQVINITHFLHSAGTPDVRHNARQDAFPLYDTQTPIQKQTVTKTHAKTLANHLFGNVAAQTIKWEYSPLFDNLLYKKDFADASLNEMKQTFPAYAPEFAITINTLASTTTDAEIFIKDFSNRLRAHLEKGIRKEDRISPKLIATMEYSQSGYMHWHLELDTSKQVKSSEQLEEKMGEIIPKCRFGRTGDYEIKDRVSDGWFHYMWKKETSVGDDKHYFTYN